MSSNTESAAERILAAARRLFAEKGFKATGVAEIGRSAGVAKSLFYHYFRSKDDVLKKIIEEFFAETEQIQQQFFLAPPADGLSGSTQHHEAHAVFTKTMLEFLRRNASVLRIIMRENMNQDSKLDLFSFFDTSYEGWRSWFKARGWPELPQPDGKVFVFFFTFLPSLAYVLFHEEFASHFESDPLLVEEKFIKFFTLSTLSLSKSLSPSPRT